jgi:cellulose synthase/poly-beta-1,6-N-acetylglucosamine synthase-like glycosyltransferase
LGRLRLQVLEAPGANISQGRNVAITAATGEVIAATDAGVRLEPGWLEALMAPFEEPGRDQPVAVVAGWFVADPQSPFEVAMGATVLPTVREIKADAFLPSSRSVAFRKTAWEAVGGYPEWLDFCEDLIFDLRLQELYGAFPFVSEAKVHFRPRGSLRAFFKQYYQYARGDGKADLWRRRHLVRYLTYLLVGPGLLALTLLHSAWWWLVLLAGAAVYTASPYRRLWPMLKGHNLFAKLGMVLLVPVIRIVGDVAKMVGYPVGLVWRLRNKDRPEVCWREAE